MRMSLELQATFGLAAAGVDHETDCLRQPEGPVPPEITRIRSWRLDDDGVLLRTYLHRMLDRGLAGVRDGRFHLLTPVPGYECVDGAKLRRPRKRQPRRDP